jgi:hypothetical protein
MAKVILGNHAGVFVPPGLCMARTESDERTGK